MLFSAFVFPLHSYAIDLSDTNLYTHQKYFLRVLGSLARADYYNTDILASVTLAQAIYEGGWGRYSLPIGGNNLFGIKAYGTWSGMVYDQNTHTLYSSYDDFMIAMGQSHINRVSAWRAHKSWAESVGVHSALFINESKYAAVVGEKDYSVMAHAIVDAGYCDDDGYAETVIKLIEQYGMTEYDDLTPDSDGVVAVIAPQERVWLDIGETFTVPLEYYPSDKTASKLVWASDNTSVATVDENGAVTAKAHGATLITATLANGREAACIVYVDCNATVIDKDVSVYTSPTSSTVKGEIYRGTALKVTSDTVYTDAAGNKMLAVSGYSKKNELISGYVLAERIYKSTRNVSQISLIKDNFTLKVGDEYAVKTVVAPADAVDTALMWVSSDESVATVDQNGVITAKKLGTAVITAKAAGGTGVTATVTVASDYRQYSAVVSAYEYVNVRTQPDASSSRAGKIPFLSKVTVVGEPIGKWYNVTGASSDGKIVSGYADAAYIRLVKDGTTAEYAYAPPDVGVYGKTDITSLKYGTLDEGSEYAILETLDNNWYYIIGLKTTGSGVYGYAQITDTNYDPDVNTGTDTPTDAWYGRTTSDLYVRTGAGSGYSIVGKFLKDTDIVISGEENGWYKVSGKSSEGVEISGYSSAAYILTLYAGVTTSNLNVRDGDTTDSDVVGRLSLGDEVVIVGEKLESGWYAVEANGLVGYCSGDYITVTGKLPAEGSTTPPVTSEEFEIVNSAYSISNGVLTGVTVNTCVKTFLEGFKGDVAVISPAGDVMKDDALVGTGCVLRVADGSRYEYVATVMIKGDVNSDGVIDSFDYITVKRTFLGTHSLNGVYLTAACVSGGVRARVIDYVMIKRAVLSDYEL